MNKVYPAEFVYSTTFLEKGQLNIIGSSGLTRHRKKVEKDSNLAAVHKEEASKDMDCNENPMESESDNTYSSFKDISENALEKQVEVQETITDPFLHEFKPTFAQILMIILNSITLAPLRLIITLLIIVTTYLVAFIGMIGLSNQQLEQRRLTGWRSVLQDWIYRLFRAALFVMGVHTIRVRGKQASFENSPILVGAPHSSIIDMVPLIVSRSIPVAKVGIAQYICRFAQVHSMIRG